MQGCLAYLIASAPWAASSVQSVLPCGIDLCSSVPLMLSLPTHPLRMLISVAWSASTNLNLVHIYVVKDARSCKISAKIMQPLASAGMRHVHGSISPHVQPAALRKASPQA